MASARRTVGLLVIFGVSAESFFLTLTGVMFCFVAAGMNLFSSNFMSQLSCLCELFFFYKATPSFPKLDMKSLPPSPPS